MMLEKNDILNNCKKNLDRDRAVATGIGLFIRPKRNAKILLRRRKEKDSLYGKDLSGKWELLGGGTELSDFREDDYQSSITSTIEREAMEEGGLKIISEKLKILLIPAWLGKGGLVDLAFAIDVPEGAFETTPEYEELLKNGEIRWCSFQDLREIEYVSKRMRYLALKSFH